MCPCVVTAGHCNIGLGLKLGAWGFAPYYIINSGCAKPEPLAYDLGAQALQLVELQDPFNCNFI
jgi:hypothetical protein